MRIYWLWLALLPGITDRQKLALIHRFHDPETIYFAKREELSRVEGLSPEAVQALSDKGLEKARETAELCGRENIRVVPFGSEAYPHRLKAIADPPMILYCKGRLPDFRHRPAIAVVGTRKATDYGLAAARALGRELGEDGGIVVSGMAQGVDAAAMWGALSSGRPVVGVLACGVDVVYPKINEGLYRAVAERGCLLSELPPGTLPLKWSFPRRNRLLSGLSCGVLVVEAPEKSGALITARQALDQGRDVFSVPGNIGVAANAGSNALLREGAIPVSCGWDVLREYAALYPDTVEETAPSQALPREKRAPGPEISGKIRQPEGEKSKKIIDKEDSPPYSDGNDIPCAPREQALLDLLRDGPLGTDEVIARAGRPAQEVMGSLTMLRIQGMVEALPGNRVGRKAARRERRKENN